MFSIVRFQFLFRLLFVIAAAFTCGSSFSFICDRAENGVISVVIEKPPVMTLLDTPITLVTTIKNSGASPLKLKLTFSTIETIEFVDAPQSERDTLTREVLVAANGEQRIDVAVVGKHGTLNAHYPVRLLVQWDDGGVEKQLDVVQPFLSTISPNPQWFNYNPLFGKLISSATELPVVNVPEHGGLVFDSQKNYRAFWTIDKERNNNTEKYNYLPVGWTGNEPVTKANLHFDSRFRGETRPAIEFHPPYATGAGTIGLEYRVHLPSSKPITFSAFAAIRDTAPSEPNSDGVTFKVIVIDNGKTTVCGEISTASKTWVPFAADISAFAGKEVTFHIVADPGAKRDTTCDGCFLGSPTFFVGQTVDEVMQSPKRSIDKLVAVCESVDTSKTGEHSDSVFLFPLAGNETRAVVAFGDNGFLDGVIQIMSAGKTITYNGIKVKIKGTPLGQSPSIISSGKWIDKRAAASTNNAGLPPRPETKRVVTQPVQAAHEWAQEIGINGEKATMFYSLQDNKGALQISIDCSEPDWITDIELGEAVDAKIERVFFGHGFCIVKPQKPFTINAGGQQLSTSHIATDYDNGISMLMATTTPPSDIRVNPQASVSTLGVHPGTRLTLLPGTSGAFDCAVRYRAINPLKPAAGVKTKAGRMCFDIWGGNFASHTNIVENAIRYGLNDSLFVIHSWQRYGYDNRLPDIWYPNPSLGTATEIRKSVELCEGAGILYGLHDNYIDYYPDASGYDYDKITFDNSGQPRRAWMHYYNDAQSYQFRPDAIEPILNRNLDAILGELPLTCYFVDVFAAMPPFDYYDRQSNLHSRTETLQHWNETFDTIRNRLTAVSRDRQTEKLRSNFNAVTISEAGQDFLAGHLDGSDCQFFYISNGEGECRLRIDCDDWERVAWFDAVNHTAFSLHGVGYSNRYEAGRGRMLHGIESDDYITAEVLTGHPAQVDLGAAYRGAVRKYYLLQPLVRELADAEVESVEFVGGNIHRQRIVWKSNRKVNGGVTTIYVNRGIDDWKIDDKHTLPLYGFYASGTFGEAGIYKDSGGVLFEMCRENFVTTGQTNQQTDTRTKSIYVNGRQKMYGGVQPICPSLNSFKYDGDGKFSCTVDWDAHRGTQDADGNPSDYKLFMHCVTQDLGWPHRQVDAVLGGGETAIPTSKWNGKVTTLMRQATIPDSLPAGDYHLVVGLYREGANGRRAELLGYDAGNYRYSIGMMNVERNNEGKVTNITIREAEQNNAENRELQKRFIPQAELATVELSKQDTINIMKTKGAIRAEFSEDGKTINITPLPGEPETDIVLLAKLSNVWVTSFDEQGKKLRDVPIVQQGHSYHHYLCPTLTTQPGEFRYEIKVPGYFFER
ncbi:MAG: hypothetical protein LBU65_17570 [Planctomycetaceae bacterium]|jgi:hypothetical protein|nr:hypothetical protein [Planctomycetaceae bacterium]